MKFFSWSEIAEGLGIAFQALKSNRLRTILTTLGIFIGVVVITVIISVIQGLNAYVKGEISFLGADTVYISRMPWTITDYEEYLEYTKRKRITEDHYEFVKRYATLDEAISLEIATRRTVKYGSESLDDVIITGTSEDYVTTQNVVAEYGRFFTPSEVNFRKNVCVIGYEVASILFEDRDPIGERIKIGANTFSIIGVLEERGQVFGQSLDNMTIIPYSVFEKIYGNRRSLEVQVKARNPDILEELIDELIGIMRRARSLGAGEPNDFSINQQSEIMDLYNSITQILYIVLIGIGSISLVVGGIGIMNIMLVSVTERTREIGIRKALGAKNRVIMWQFLVESMFVSAIGVTIGILISMGIAMIVRSATPIPVNISLWVLFLGIAFTVTIGIFFGLYPASKAARLDPVEALRYE
ncbi:ABC transporter permease [bacterium]|nr:ABC transporter permease [bacterium]